MIETLPAGVTAISHTGDHFVPPGTFTRLGSGMFTYTIQVSAAVPNGTVLAFNGTFKDSFASPGTVTGATMVAVGSLLPPEVLAFDENGDGIIQRVEAVNAVLQFFNGAIPRATAVAVVLEFFG